MTGEIGQELNMHWHQRLSYFPVVAVVVAFVQMCEELAKQHLLSLDNARYAQGASLEEHECEEKGEGVHVNTLLEEKWSA